jgi:hypothetical protein
MTDPTQPPVAPRNRRRLIIFAVVSAIGAVWIIAAALLLPDFLDDVNGDDVVSPPVASPPADLGDVKTYQDLPTTHVDEPVSYDQSPPVGGPHDEQWLACGVYDVPLRNENAVHDLEHGSVWITYEPGLDAADLQTLADALPADGIMSPYPGLSAPVVVTVWGAQLELDGADDPRLSQFIDTYADETAPEPFASCEGGLTDPQGGEQVSARG